MTVHRAIVRFSVMMLVPVLLAAMQCARYPRTEHAADLTAVILRVQ